MGNIKESEIKKIGFKLVKNYKHNQFETNRYELGLLEVEFTYLKSKLVTCDVTINDVNCVPVSIAEIVALNEILNK
jgi:hypothetical protein